MRFAAFSMRKRSVICRRGKGANFDLSNGLKLVWDTHFVGLKMFVKREVCTDFASAPLPYDGKITQKPYTESKSANDCAVGEGLAPPAFRCFEMFDTAGDS